VVKTKTRANVRTIRTSTLTLILALAFGWTASGQESAQPPPEAAQAAPLTAKAVLGPGDTIRIASLSSEELSKEWRIGETGRLHLPLIGAVDVAGMTVAEFQAILNDRYREFIKDPMIDVFLTDIQSRPVSVYGAVRTPQTYQLKGPTTLARLIQQAGGVNEGAFAVTLVRETQWGIADLPKPKLLEGGKVQVEMSVEEVLRGFGPAADIQVRPYDMVRVETRPERIVFIAGEVNNPGAVQLDTVDGVRLSKALAFAGGYKTTAGYQNALLWREGQSAEGAIEVHLRDVMRGKAEDIMLRSGDYLIVPPKHGFIPTMRAILSIASPISTSAVILTRF
jgi:polysaccharide export outer membrane protein